MFKTLYYCMSSAFWQAGRPNPGRSNQRLLPIMLNVTMHNSETNPDHHPKIILMQCPDRISRNGLRHS